MPSKLNLVLLGPYGAGKGTQAHILRTRFDMAYFDTGTELRNNVEEKTPIGLKAKEIMDRGELVPNELIMEMVSAWIEKVPRGKNILFDGIPRLLEQAKTFDQVLANKNISVLRIFIEISKEESIRRQVERRICQKCNKIFPITFKEDACDFDYGALIIRKENNPEIAEKRADIYEKETIPVIEYYKKNNSIISVNGLLSIEEVTKEIIEKILN